MAVRTLWPTLKRVVVRLLGRERANRIGAPYHHWRACRRTQSFLAQLPAKDLCVNIGCGPNPLPGWINLDVARAEKIDVVWNLRRGLPFPDNSCTAIFAEHVIEHMTREEAAVLLKEAYRALQKGGVVRLSTPDAELYLRSYAGNGQFLRHPGFPQEIETSLDRINLMMRESGQHLWVYDAESLALMLRKAGFTSVMQTEFNVSQHPAMQVLDGPGRAFESLYIEARK